MWIALGNVKRNMTYISESFAEVWLCKTILPQLFPAEVVFVSFVPVRLVKSAMVANFESFQWQIHSVLPSLNKALKRKKLITIEVNNTKWYNVDEKSSKPLTYCSPILFITILKLWVSFHMVHFKFFISLFSIEKDTSNKQNIKRIILKKLWLRQLTLLTSNLASVNE